MTIETIIELLMLIDSKDPMYIKDTLVKANLISWIESGRSLLESESLESQLDQTILGYINNDYEHLYASIRGLSSQTRNNIFYISLTDKEAVYKAMDMKEVLVTSDNVSLKLTEHLFNINNNILNILNYRLHTLITMINASDTLSIGQFKNIKN